MIKEHRQVCSAFSALSDIHRQVDLKMGAVYRADCAALVIDVPGERSAESY